MQIGIDLGATKIESVLLDENGKETPEGTEAGVAIVIKNELKNYIWDVNPVSNRLMSISIGYAITISVISVYIPTAQHDLNYKEQNYKNLSKLQNQLQKQGPTYTMGDFNARVQTKEKETENK